MVQETRRRPRPLLRAVIGDVLRRTRLEQGRTLADVARAARVSLAYLSELERGRKEASSEVLAAICDALRIELPGLLAEAGHELAAARSRRVPVIRPAVHANGRPDQREVPALSPQAPAARPEASVIPLADLRGRSSAPSARRTFDTTCLLAA